MTFGPAMAGCASDEQMKDKSASATTPAEATGMQTERTDAYRNPTDMYRGFRASELINKKVAGDGIAEEGVGEAIVTSAVEA